MSNTTADFDEIVDPIRHEMPEFPAERSSHMAAMPELTPGEGGAFGLAALLIGAGLVADLPMNVQLASIAGGVLLGMAGAFTTRGIRRYRNETEAARLIAEAEASQPFVIGGDEGDE